MALKDIFTMIKADRYTADGCEEIKKAQNAIKEETEDAGLPDGTQRQRKDGLYVKQGGKWVPAPVAKGAKKNGPDMNAEKAKHAEARKDRESAGAKQDLPADLQKQAQEYVAWEKPEVIQRYINNLRKPFSIERDSFKEPDKLAEALEIELKKKTESKPAGSAPKFETEQENAKYEEGLKGWDNVDPARLPDIKTKVEQKIAYYKKYDPYAMVGKKTGLSAAQKESVKQNMAQAKENLAFYTGQLEGINKKMSSGSESKPEDSAPRVLTGDCKIRIRK